MNLMRYYNQNRKKIWGILIIIASAFIFLQLLGYAYQKKDSNVPVIQNNTTIANTNTTSLTTNKSVVTGENLSKNQLQDATTVIDNFISYCNTKELQKAYDLLTNECKMQMYHTLEVFEQTYYKDVFQGGNKTCSIENWVGDTYKVKIVDDMLTTGKSNNNYSKQDYITVKKEDNGYKLNINNYIGYKTINKTTTKNDISVEVISKNTYMENEEYTIKVTNNMKNKILLDSRLNTKTLAIQDSKEVQYSSYSHELTEPMLTVPSGQTKEVTIKFYSSYVSSKNIKYIVFSDLALYDEQDRISDKIQFKANV